MLVRQWSNKSTFGSWKYGSAIQCCIDLHKRKHHGYTTHMHNCLIIVIGRLMALFYLDTVKGEMQKFELSKCLRQTFHGMLTNMFATDVEHRFQRAQGLLCSSSWSPATGTNRKFAFLIYIQTFLPRSFCLAITQPVRGKRTVNNARCNESARKTSGATITRLDAYT